MAEVDAVRRFNRFYTRQIGLLGQGYLDSPFTLAEVRVLYEIAHGGSPAAAGIAKALGLDPGYLSRMLRSFQNRGLLVRRPSQADARQSHLSLTRKGRAAFEALEKKSQAGVAKMIGQMSPAEQIRLTSAMQTIQELLGERPEPRAPYLLRAHQPGDLGWVIHRHGVVYSQEYGWDEQFEAIVARIASDFIQNFDPKRERCWIAERDGVIAGSVFLVKQSGRVAKLRLLLVEPSARGLGIGGRLVDECVRFARQAGYRKITLWTQSILDAARHIYGKAGFRLVKQQRNEEFGEKLISETWELTL
ncbi:MAG TPA: helix-turn-helix domain-containing GNAT family N-acetyltransferase [Bryobacteraceae bacterium]|nr:helix-turn-helix domain-containing GNAT family N-acetyltransferase [Bryobacteraceae bacterium]